MRHARQEDAGHRTAKRCGFTLLELLVVVGIIALLIAFLLPALSRAKEAAMDARCLTNHRQFGVAFAAYAADFDCFPVDDYTTYASVKWCWGGVDWYSEDADIPQWLDPNRPLNKYVGATKRHKFRLEVFRCPRDSGVRYYTSDNLVNWQADFGLQTNAPEGPESVFAVLGNSYHANDWMYCQPGSNIGIGDYPEIPFYRTDLGPDNVETAPSRFIIVCDIGQAQAGRYPLERRIEFNIVYGWWHGYEIGQMTFLDGSARAEEMGDVTTQTYTFYMAPDRHGPMSYRRFDRP